MDDESGESMEPMEEVPLSKLGESQLERLVRGCRMEVRMWSATTEIYTILFVGSVRCV